jgi:hypothetical protein
MKKAKSEEKAKELSKLAENEIVAGAVQWLGLPDGRALTPCTISTLTFEVCARRDSMLDFSLRFLSAAEVDLLLAKEQHTKER